jgi:hypothetical protein
MEGEDMAMLWTGAEQVTWNVGVLRVHTMWRYNASQASFNTCFTNNIDRFMSLIVLVLIKLCCGNWWGLRNAWRVYIKKAFFCYQLSEYILTQFFFRHSMLLDWSGRPQCFPQRIVFLHNHARRCWVWSFVWNVHVLFDEMYESTVGCRLTTDFCSDWQVVSRSGRMSAIYLLTVFFKLNILWVFQ